MIGEDLYSQPANLLLVPVPDLVGVYRLWPVVDRLGVVA
jgi:hypothetical protein